MKDQTVFVFFVFGNESEALDFPHIPPLIREAITQILLALTGGSLGQRLDASYRVLPNIPG